jgi:hypothetical protein
VTLALWSSGSPVQMSSAGAERRHHTEDTLACMPVQGEHVWLRVCPCVPT